MRRLSLVSDELVPTTRSDVSLLRESMQIVRINMCAEHRHVHDNQCQKSFDWSSRSASTFLYELKSPLTSKGLSSWKKSNSRTNSEKFNIVTQQICSPLFMS